MTFSGSSSALHNFILHKDAKPKFGSAYSFNLIYRGRELQKLDGYTTDLFTDEAIGFIDRQADKPWFLYLAYNAVHTPLEMLEKHEARIPASITDPDRRGYASLLLGLDDAVGQVAAHLRKTGCDKDTLVFFFSDNGGSGHKPYMAYNTAVNTPLRGDKSQTLEGGIRVPFFVSWPGKIPAGKIYEQPVIALDVLPTTLAAVGVPPPADCDGVDLMPHLTGANKAPPHASLSWRFGPQRAIRRGSLETGRLARFRYARRTAAGSCTICRTTSANSMIWQRLSPRSSPSSRTSGKRGTPRTSLRYGMAIDWKIRSPRTVPRRRSIERTPAACTAKATRLVAAPRRPFGFFGRRRHESQPGEELPVGRAKALDQVRLERKCQRCLLLAIGTFDQVINPLDRQLGNRRH